MAIDSAKNAKDLTLFNFSPKLTTLYATIVLPIEATHRLPSLHPAIYTLKYFGDFFMYIPGGHAGAGRKYGCGLIFLVPNS